jgi:cytochrome c oxidase cbb3-type subunit IV
MSLHDIYQFAAQLWVVWLVLLFVGIIVWVYLPRNRKRMNDMADLPLRDDEER